MSYHATHYMLRALRVDGKRAADLLARYPRVSDEESREILAFLRTGRHLDVGLLTTDDRLRPRLDAFMEDHKAHFQVKWSEGAALVLAIAALLGMFWLIWTAFA